MKKNIVKGAALVLSMALLICFPVKASAEEVTEARVPVTLTVITTEKPISVTVPAALPVSVVDGDVLVANNAKISNNAERGSVRVTAVAVENGSLTVAGYDGFDGDDNTIALSINGCGTEGPGDLDITDAAFPDIEAGKNLPINYQAKVAVSKDVKDLSAATVIFTIEAVD